MSEKFESFQNQVN